MVFWFAKQLPVDETLSATDAEKDVQNSRYNDLKSLIIKAFLLSIITCYTIYMIKKEFRIQKKYFPLVLKGPSIQGTYFRVIVSSPILDADFKSVVIISKKYAKKSIHRNLIRRTVYRVIKENTGKIPKKILVFIMSKPLPLGNSTSERQNAQQELLKDIGYIIDQLSKKYAKNT